MNSPTDAVTSLVGLALDTATLRHAVIANNIANANSVNHARGRVDFDSQLGALRAALSSGAPVDARMWSGVRPVVRTEAPRAANGAALDLEAADLAQNTLHYEALLKALGKHFSVMQLAINEGKR